MPFCLVLFGLEGLVTDWFIAPTGLGIRVFWDLSSVLLLGNKEGQGNMLVLRNGFPSSSLGVPSVSRALACLFYARDN